MSKTHIAKQSIRILHTFQVLLVVAIVVLLYNYIPMGKKALTTLYIDGNTTQTVSASLKKHGYTLTFIDTLMLRMEELPQTGWYTLEKNNSGRFGFFKNMYQNKAKTMKIVIYAGETYTDVLKRLANDLKIDVKKLETEYTEQTPFKEAALIAGHYRVARKVQEKALMFYLFAKSKKVLDSAIDKSFTNRPDHFELKVLLTIASIIQKESNRVDEMTLISAVIYNRLKKKMKLQMDSTLNYGEFSHTIVSSERIKTDMSYYNTYKHKGLPPYPLGSVSVDALRAAMFPEDCKHLFFMLKPSGRHAFCESYEEHLTNIRTFRAHQKRKAEEKKKKLAEKKLEDEKKKKLAEAKEEAKIKKQKENNVTRTSVTENNTSENNLSK